MESLFDKSKKNKKINRKEKKIKQVTLYFVPYDGLLKDSLILETENWGKLQIVLNIRWLDPIRWRAGYIFGTVFSAGNILNDFYDILYPK